MKIFGRGERHSEPEDLSALNGSLGELLKEQSWLEERHQGVVAKKTRNARQGLIPLRRSVIVQNQI